LWSSVLLGYTLVTLGTLAPGAAHAKCGEHCDASYSPDIDDCRFQYYGPAADADDLADCIQEARNDYRSRLKDCTSAEISRPRWWRLAKGSLTVPDLLFCPRASAQLNAQMRP
jgi:hypothetical protein